MTRNAYSVSLEAASVWMPETCEEAMELKKKYGNDAIFIAGGTFLPLKWEKGIPVPEHLISLERISGFSGIGTKVYGGMEYLSLGAFITLSNLKRHPLTPKEIRNAAGDIASPAVRNRGTIGGNISGGTGDLLPLLFVLNAKASLYDFSFHTSIRDLLAWHNEGMTKEGLLTEILLPSLPESSRIFSRKLGRREAFVPSIVTVAGTVECGQPGICTAVRIAAGGGDTLPRRLFETEKLLLGKEIKELDWKNVYYAILDEYDPVPDAYSSAAYRKKAAANLIVSNLQIKLQEEGSGNDGL